MRVRVRRVQRVMWQVERMPVPVVLGQLDEIAVVDNVRRLVCLGLVIDSKALHRVPPNDVTRAP